jgi:hypothetical protein
MSPASTPPLSSWDRNPGAAAVHILVSTLYAVIAWLALLAWLVIADGPVLLVLLASPLVFSGLIVVVTAAGLAFIGLRWLWRCRGSLRLRRSLLIPFQARARRDLN